MPDGVLTGRTGGGRRDHRQPGWDSVCDDVDERAEDEAKERCHGSNQRGVHEARTLAAGTYQLLALQVPTPGGPATLQEAKGFVVCCPYWVPEASPSQIAR